MSDNVGSVIFESGMVENVGVAVGIASKSVSAQKLFPFPVTCYETATSLLLHFVWNWIL
jgi:hypothetical protein